MSEGRGLHCPNCSQQVAPGVRCWSCGTVTPLSLGRRIARVGACFAPLAFCAFFGGLGVLMAHFEGKAEDERREAQRKLDAIDAAEQKAKEEARLAAWRAANQPPEFPAGAIYRPTFVTKVGTTTAGVAFVVDGVGPRPIVLTARHLLGPVGGLAQEIPPWKLKDALSNLILSPAFGQVSDQDRVSLGQSVIPLATRDDPGAAQAGDVVAFWTPRTVAWLKAFRLAAAPPAKGDRVWLLSPLPSGTAQLHPATCYGFRDGEVGFKYDDRDLDLRGTSGAPILNGAGEVVGINIGSFKSDKGLRPLLGSATLVSKFLNPLRRACQAHPPGE